MKRSEPNDRPSSRWTPRRSAGRARLLLSAALLAGGVTAAATWTGVLTSPVQAAPAKEPATPKDGKPAKEPAPTKAASATKPGKSHAPAPGDGVASLDVATDGRRLHLLIARRETEDSQPVLEYQRSDDGGARWTAPQAIVHNDLPPPVGARRGMDVQLAVSGDRVVAAWTIYSAESRFGRGKIATAVSSDGGKTWIAGPNPADDGSDGDHAFLDLATDGKGVIHAVWLDSRLGRKALIYSRSADGGASWSPNVVLDDESCECCWNTITAVGDRVLVLYRDKGPRDMAMLTSDDGGRTWGKAATVGAFDWQFDGCPHVGGGIAVQPQPQSPVLATVWTGKSGVMGSYVQSSPDGGRTWSPPSRLGESNSMRSDIAARDGKAVVAWDAVSDGQGAVYAMKSSDGGKTWSPPQKLSEPGVSATYPRVLPAGDGFRVFWTESADGKADAWQSKAM